MSTMGELSTRIAGEIVLSSAPGMAIKKWRELVHVSQGALAESLGVSPSVISDYERGRRVPGSDVVKRIVGALVQADEVRGAAVAKSYGKTIAGDYGLSGVMEIREFTSPVKAKEILSAVKGKVVANGKLLAKDLFGYTIIDSVKAILELTAQEFYRLYGMTSERALVFTNVSSGRSPFIAIKVSSLKPGMVVLHGLDKVDPLGVELANREKIPVVLSTIKEVDELMESMRRNIP